MFKFGFLLDAATDAAGQGGEQTANPLSSFLPFILIIGLFVVLYFFTIRPQKKQEKKDAAMRDAIQPGDEVTTIGGIIGKVVSVKGETFVLETTKDKTKIRFLKGAIRSVDVKAADLAAQIIESKKAEAEEANADAEAAADTEAPIAENAENN